MGFGKLVAEATGKKEAEDASPSGLKDLILERYGRSEDVPPPSLDRFYYRASGLAYLCPRLEVLRFQHQVTAKVRKPPEEIANYDVGTGMHHVMQNLILPKVGVIRGAWRCLACSHLYGGLNPGETRPVHEVAIPRPDVCRCGSKDFLYEEYHLKDVGVGTGGHMDGLLVLPGHEGVGLFELKSISQSGAKNIRNVPQIEHVIQANVYMWLAGLKWARILYWVKGVYSLDKNLIEHHLDPDPEVVVRVKEQLASIRVGMRTGKLPDRVCAHRACSQAQDCPVLNQCFGDPPPDANVGRF